MNDQEVDRIATRVVELMNQERNEHCLFPSVHRRNLHAFAEATTPEAAATLGKISRHIENTSNKLASMIIWIICIAALAFIGNLGYSKLMSLMPK